MPRAVASKAAGATITINAGAPEPAQDVVEKPQQPKMSFWERLARISAAEWGRDYVIYLYRESPKVRMAGQGGYLCKLAQPFSPEDVKARYGGGTFKAMLNKGQNLIDTEVFEVEGIPIFDITRENPNGAGGAGIAAPSASESQVLKIVEEQMRAMREEISRMRDRGEQVNPAQERALDVLTTAYKRGLEVNVAQPPDPMKSLDSAVALIERIRPAAPTAGGGILETISVLKELGVFQKPKTLAEQLAELASLRELMGDAGGGGKTTWLDLARDAVPRVLDTLSAAAANQQIQQRPRPVPPQRAATPQPAQQQQLPAQPSAAPSSSGLRMVPVDETGEIHEPQPVNVAAEEPFSVVMRKKIVETVHFGEDAENDATDIVNFLQIAWPEGARYLETLSEDQITNFFAMDPILVVATQEPRWRDVLTHAKAYALEMLAEPPAPPRNRTEMLPSSITRTISGCALAAVEFMSPFTTSQ